MILEGFISFDNPVRVIDIFVEQLNLTELGFTKTKLSREGCPPFEARHLLKLSYYGYINSNPVRARIVNKVEDYIYSSAADNVFGK